MGIAEVMTLLGLRVQMVDNNLKQNSSMWKRSAVNLWKDFEYTNDAAICEHIWMTGKKEKKICRKRKVAAETAL
jgi:hypothetical protein